MYEYISKVSNYAKAMPIEDRHQRITGMVELRNIIGENDCQILLRIRRPDQLGLLAAPFATHNLARHHTGSA